MQFVLADHIERRPQFINKQVYSTPSATQEKATTENLLNHQQNRKLPKQAVQRRLLKMLNFEGFNKDTKIELDGKGTLTTTT